MKLLLLGGTRFVGRHIAEAMLSGGHAVTILTRGQTLDLLPAHAERLRGDRDKGAAGLHALKNRKWDVCVDVSGYLPRQVRASVELLRGHVEHYIFVSAVSVYGDPVRGPVTESDPRLPPAGDEVIEITSNAIYGECKSACEEIVEHVFAGRYTILRPQVVAGPYDPEVRFSYWVQRAMQGGEMLAPGDGSDFLQVIDARDLAQFTRNVAEKRITGIFNLAGPRLRWIQFMDILGARNVVWVPMHIIKSAGLTERELPLYRPDGGVRSSLMDVSNASAISAGLELSTMDVTVTDTRAWLASEIIVPPISPKREAELIRLVRQKTEVVIKK